MKNYAKVMERIFNEEVRKLMENQDYFPETIKQKIRIIIIQDADYIDDEVHEVKELHGEILEVYKYGDKMNIGSFMCPEKYIYPMIGYEFQGVLYAKSIGLWKNYFWKFIDKFLKLETNYEHGDAEWLLPVRWIGAYNTGANAGNCSFVEALEYETEPAEREKAAQVIGEIEEIENYAPYYGKVEDMTLYTKVGILYERGACREAYINDVWSYNIGKYLMADRDTYPDSLEEHKMNPLLGFFKYIEDNICELVKGSIDSVLPDYVDAREYYLAKEWGYHLKDSSLNKQLFEQLLEFANIDEENLRTHLICNGDVNIKFLRAIMKRIDNVCSIHCLYDDQFSLHRVFHTEGFIKVGSKPTGIIVRGRIKDSNYYELKKIAKRKNLEIVHVL